MSPKVRTTSISLLVAVSLCSASLAETWSATNLGTLGGSWSTALDINNRGQIVGASITAGGSRRAFLWENGRMRDLGTLGGDYSVARALNDRGQVVGTTEKGPGDHVGFIWENGTMTELAGITSPSAINGRGQVVGGGENAKGKFRAMIWDRGQVVVLGALGGRSSDANGINDRGQVVGALVTTAGDERAFLWQEGEMTELTMLPGGRQAWAFDINDRGQIAGWSETADGSVHAVMWDNGEIIDLGTLGGAESWAHAINERGQITGHSLTDEGGPNGFIWEQGSFSDFGINSFTQGLNDWAQVAGEDYQGRDSFFAMLYEERKTVPISSDDFESGDTGRWSGAQRRRLLPVTAAAALRGFFGLEVNAGEPAWLQHKAAKKESVMRIGFDLNPHTLQLPRGRRLDILVLYRKGRGDQIRVTLEQSGEDQFKIQAYARLENGSYRRAGTVKLRRDRSTRVDIVFSEASGPGRKDGALRLFRDFAPGPGRDNLRNFGSRVDYLRLGAVGGEATDRTGSFYLDDFQSFRILAPR